MKTNRIAWAAVAACLFCCGGVASAQYNPGLFGPPGGRGNQPGLWDPSLLTPVGAQVALTDEPPANPAPPAPGGCPPGGCPGVCNNCDCGECVQCCKCRCPLKFGVFAELLYLNPRNAEVAYAQGGDGPIGGGVIGNAIPLINPFSRTATVEPTERAGFRGGVTYYFNDCVSTVTATYTRFESMDADNIAEQPGRALFSLVVPPPANNAAITTIFADASESVDFQFLDVDFKSPFFWTDTFKLSFLAGGRYGVLNQEFISDTAVNGGTRYTTNVDFEGAGIRLGLDAVGDIGCTGIFGYGKGTMSLLGGTFRADYLADDVFLGVIADSSLRARRVVTIMETEIGVGWHSRENHIRVSAGYMFNTWYNVLKAQEYINSVRFTNPTDPSDNFNGMLTFDGLVARVEGSW